eukprot:14268_1
MIFTELQWFTICSIGLCGMINITILTSAIYQLCIKDSSIWINKLYRNLTLIAMLSFTICVIGDLIHVIIRDINFSNYAWPYDTTEAQLSAANDFVYYLANVTVYVLLLLRIYIPFDLKNCVMCFISFLICMYSLSAMA